MSDDTEFAPDKVFLHLSDIHFRAAGTGDVHDPDNDLRNELERDLRDFSASSVKKIDGIIVSGDIAFAGKPSEFEIAKDWLEHIAELIDCPPSSIMVTPGNHDVDRSKVIPDCEIEKIHGEIREPDTLQQRDSVIASVLRDAIRAPELLSTIGAYNEFAKGYQCDVSGDQPFWERNFELGYNQILRIRGMTSTLISGPHDDIHTHKMVYGGAQRQLPRHDDVFRVVVGHHPPSWTLEGDDADRAFSMRAAVQLFGHKHDQWLTKIGRSLRVIAGAFHPDRREPQWEPRYSLIALRADDERRLHIRVYPRKWTREEEIFMPDYCSKAKNYRDHVYEAS